jgi:hypothetical protein
VAWLGTVLLVVSLLQLEWNSRVYTEGLFGLVLSALIFHSLWNRPRSLAYWSGLGAGLGLLCLTRPNGILMAPGLLALWWFNRRNGATWRHAALAFGVLLTALSPWLLRNALHFGNPFHIAGSAGLLRADHAESATFTLAEFLGQNGVLFPITRLVLGVPRFFRDLHFFEHGLEIIPLLLAAWALWRRRFYNPFVATGFALTFAACCYAAYNSWAGVRYFSAFLPFVYAAGIAEAWNGINRIADTRWRALAGLALGVILVVPVIHPHRFYERRYSTLDNAPLKSAVAEHRHALQKLLPSDGVYYAGNLCQLNFLSENLRCVGLQHLVDTAWFARSEAEFRPRLLALRRGEDSAFDVRKALQRYRAAGFSWDTAAALDSTFYLRLIEPGEARSATPPNFRANSQAPKAAGGSESRRRIKDAATPFSGGNPKNAKPSA